MPAMFSKNREQLIKHNAVIEFFNEVLSIAQKKGCAAGDIVKTSSRDLLILQYKIAF